MKTVKLKMMLVVVLLTFAFCSGLLAQVQPPPRPGPQSRESRPDPRMEQAINMMFQDMDINQDGKISKKEWMAAQERQFQRLDKNGDGFISKDEVIADMMERLRESQQQQRNDGGRIAQ